MYALVVLWFFSLLSGILLSALSSGNAYHTFALTLFDSPAPFCLFLVCVLPVAITAIALQFPTLVPLYAIVILVGLSHSYTGTIVYFTQGSAAWLIRSMLLFSTGCSSVLMWWLILQSGAKRQFCKNLCLVGILICIVFVVDFFIVSPILRDLIMYF